PVGPPPPTEALVDVGLRRHPHDAIVNTIRSRFETFREPYSAVTNALDDLEADPVLSEPLTAQERADGAFPYEAYAPAVFRAAEWLVFFGESNELLFPTCRNDSESDTAMCLREFFELHGPTFWRRAVPEEEVTAFVEPYAGLPFDAALRRRFLAAVMLSPRFLFVIEHGQGGTEANDTAELSSYELASRLSYFVWRDAPDAELLEAAANGALLDEAGLAAQTERLLADPRSNRFFSALAEHWLHIDEEKLDFNSLSRSRQFRYAVRRLFDRPLELTSQCDGRAPDDRPDDCHYVRVGYGRDGERIEDEDRDARRYYERLRAGLLTEVADFLRYVVVRESGTLEDVFLRQIAPARSPEVAEIYRVTPWDGESDAPTLDDDRGGILGRAGFVASAQPVTRPIIRGFQVWEGALCRELAEPPADVTFLPPPDVPSYTTRELIAYSTAEPSCQGCHTRLNDFAFALEGLDPIGQVRTTEPFLQSDIRWDRVEQPRHADVLEASHMPVDVNADVLLAPDMRTPVAGARGLAEAIVAYRNPEVSVLNPAGDVGDAYRCFAKNLIELGYDGSVVDEGTVRAVESAVREGTVREAVLALVQSPEFQSRVFHAEEGSR
ncbi:MAG: DUF1592 domain-containing protein, partial [Myxococcota bacterium]